MRPASREPASPPHSTKANRLAAPCESGRRLVPLLPVRSRSYDHFNHYCNLTARSSFTKFYALGQWQFARVVNRIRLAPHIRFPGVAATLAAAAGVLFAAESPSNFRAARSAIDIRDPAIASGHTDKSLSFAHIIGKDA